MSEVASEPALVIHREGHVSTEPQYVIYGENFNIKDLFAELKLMLLRSIWFKPASMSKTLQITVVRVDVQN